MDSFARDFKFGFRQLRRTPVFTLAAILTLALGIGANATVFTWFNGVVINLLHGVPAGRDLIRPVSAHRMEAKPDYRGSTT